MDSARQQQNTQQQETSIAFSEVPEQVEGISEFVDALGLSPKNGNTATSITSTSFSTSTSLMSDSKSVKNSADYVRYLLDGSGVEDRVNFAALRKELDSGHPSLSSNVLDSVHWKTSLPSGPGDVSFDIAQSRRQDLDDHQQRPSKFSVAAREALAEVERLDQESALANTKGFSRQTSTSVGDGMTAHVLANLSEELVANGFTPLDPSILYAPLTPETISPLSNKQMDSIASTIRNILHQYTKRGELVQQMANQLTDSESKVRTLSTELKSKDSTWSNRLENNTNIKIIKDMEEELFTTRTKLRSTVSELGVAQSEVQDLQFRNSQLQRTVTTKESEVSRLRAELSEVVSQYEKNRLRNERTLLAVKNQYSLGGLDRVLMDIVDVYENRIGQLTEEISRLSELATAEREAPAPAPPKPTKPVHRPTNSDEEDLDDPDMIDADYDGNYKRITKVLRSQVKTLKTKLDDTNKSLEKAEQDKEVLKLQLLSYKKPAWAEKTANANKKLSTRDLIRRDKSSHKLKLFKIDALDVDDCRAALKEICIKLDIADVDQLLLGLENVEKVLKLLPQMQSFIKQADSLIWQHKTRLTEPWVDVSESSGEKLFGQGIRNKKVLETPPRKLHETLRELEKWKSMVSEVESLKEFRKRVYDLVGLMPSAGTDTVCLQLLRKDLGTIDFAALTGQNKQQQQQQQGNAKENPTTMKMVNYFRDLFEVDSMDTVFSKMNDLYVYVTEVDTAVMNLRKIMDIDSSVEAGRVLVRAADIVAHALLNQSNNKDTSTSPRRTSRSFIPLSRLSPSGPVTSVETSTSPIRNFAEVDVSSIEAFETRQDGNEQTGDVEMEVEQEVVDSTTPKQVRSMEDMTTPFVDAPAYEPSTSTHTRETTVTKQNVSSSPQRNNNGEFGTPGVTLFSKFGIGAGSNTEGSGLRGPVVMNLESLLGKVKNLGQNIGAGDEENVNSGNGEEEDGVERFF